MNTEELVDITTIKINRMEDKENRIIQFIEQIKNPYAFKVGGITVHVTFKKEGPSFQEIFEDLVKTNLGKCP
ncbi:MAG: hypothetical protein IJX91_00690 [Clostridia bacterium]|nr:hypothetical protein [Clostridia bacterium]